MIYVVLVAGHLHGVYTSPVDAHLQAKPLNATVEQCQLNSEVRLELVPCEHEWIVESMYGTKSERLCSKCNCYQSDLRPGALIKSDGSGSGPRA